MTASAPPASLDSLLQPWREFLDALQLPITLIDQQGRFRYFNQASARIDGTQPEAVLGRHLLEACPSLSADTSTLLRCLQGQRFINCHQRYKNPLGQVFDYLHTALPLQNAQGQIVGAIEVGRDLSDYRRLTEQVVDLSARLGRQQDRQPELDIISKDAAMLQQLAHLDACARTDVPILLYGETGTGKELFARRVHRHSQRAEQAWITLNCAAIPATLLESTLFGTSKGAFTGAENRPGLFTLADGGTLFLDELNSMPIELQSKLLRVLQDGRLTPLGSARSQQVNVRIVAALNQPPWEEIRAGRLREDLFYRLNVGFIRIPPLRERRQDIALLVQHFIERYAPEIRPSVQGVSEPVLAELMAHSWPGNVRMLENLIQRSLLLSEEQSPWLSRVYGLDEAIAVPDSHHQPQVTPSAPAATHPNLSLPEQLIALERQLIQQALKDQHGHIGKAAEQLGIPRTTLQSKLKKMEQSGFQQ